MTIFPWAIISPPGYLAGQSKPSILKKNGFTLTQRMNKSFILIVEMHTLTGFSVTLN